ncbi:glycosyltransferase [Acinetobacter baumannii]
MSNKSPEWNLKIYGTGENLDDLTKIITERKLKNVKLMGAASNIDEIYKKAAFFVMSSRFEGLPMVLIEAQTFGLPIVSYDCPHGPSEVIDHEENGLLVENQNSEALAKAIQRLIDQPEVRLEYSKSAKKSAQRFTTTSILNEWKNLVGCL